MKNCLFSLSFLFVFSVAAQDENKKLLIHHWKLHNISKIENGKFDIPIGDTQLKIAFKENGLLIAKANHGILHYQWELTDETNLTVKRTDQLTKANEEIEKVLRLEEVNLIRHIDEHNLMLETPANNGVRYRYHYVRHFHED